MVRIIKEPLDNYVNGMQVKHESGDMVYIQDENLQLPRKACLGGYNPLLVTVAQ